MDVFPLKRHEQENITTLELDQYFDKNSKIYMTSLKEIYNSIQKNFGALTVMEFLDMIKIALKADGRLWNYLAGKGYQVHDKKKYIAKLTHCAKLIINQVWPKLKKGKFK